MLKFTNAPMPPRQITIEGTNKEFQQLAQWLDNALDGVTNPNVSDLIVALRGAE